MLIKCSECAREASDKAETCPTCGAPIAGKEAPASTVRAEPAPASGRMDIPWTWIAAVAVAGIAVFTKPGILELEDRILADIRASIQQQEITNEDNIVSGLLKFGCAVYIHDCAALISQQVSFTERDVIVAKVVHLEFNGEKSRCFGAFRTWWCGPEA